ncbi:MAG: hypothetical protein HZC17_06540 [Candidatus Omnitrophica bacterium]|nr:hypothetical protein [Candidatus Omnitrophota bacterium]
MFLLSPPNKKKMTLSLLNKNKFTALFIAAIFICNVQPILFADENPSRSKVISIQDAHSNYEAQSQIRDILKKLTIELKPVTILVEGASKSLDPTMFQFTYSRDLNKQIAEKLSEKGFVSGAELFTLEPESASVTFAGLEDEGLYEKEKNDFISIISEKSDTEGALSVLRSQLDALKARVFNSKLKEIDRKFSAYENGKTTLLSWFDALGKLVKETLGLLLADPREAARFPNLVRLAISRAASGKINASALEAEKRQLAATLSNQNLIRFVQNLGAEKQSTSQENFQALAEELHIDWLKYPEVRKAVIALLLSKEMEATALFHEMEDVKNAIYERLAQTASEKKTVSLDRDLRLLGEILSLESTRDVWNSVKERTSSINPAEWQRRLKELSLGVKDLDGKSAQALEDSFKRAVDFYTLAEEREQIFMKRIQAALSSGNVIVVSGGFHAEGLERAARGQNFDFSMIQPQLKNKSDLSRYYQAVFQSSSLPFLVSKMAAEPFNETDFHAQVLAEILTEFENGTLPVTVPVEEVNESPFMTRNGGKILEENGRFEFKSVSAQSLGAGEKPRNLKELVWDLSRLSKTHVTLKKITAGQPPTIKVFGDAKGGPADCRIEMEVPFEMTPEMALAVLLKEKNLPVKLRRVAEELSITLVDIMNRLSAVNEKFPDTLEIHLNTVPQAAHVAPVTVIAATVNVDGKSIHQINIQYGAKTVPAAKVLSAVLQELKSAENVPEFTAVAESMHALALAKAPALLAPGNQQMEMFPAAITPARSLTANVITTTSLEDTAITSSSTDANLHLFPSAETQEAVTAFASVQRQPRLAASAIVQLSRDYIQALTPEKIGENLEVQKTARFYVRGANIFIGNDVTVRNNVRLIVAPTGRLLIGNNVILSIVTIVVGEGQTVVIGNNVNLIGNIQVPPIGIEPGQKPEQFPSLIIENGARVKLPAINIPQDAQVVIPQGTTGNAPKNIQIPAGKSTILVETPNPKPGLPNLLNPQPNITFLKPIQAQSLGAPDVNRVFNTSSPVPSLVPNVPASKHTPVNIPKLLPTSFQDVPSTDHGGNFQDFLKFIVAARAGVAPENLSREQMEALAQEIEIESALLRPLIREGILTPVVSVPSKYQVALSADLAKLPQGVNRQFLEGLVHNLKNHRVAVTVGISDPKALYSLNSPEFRDSVAFHLETNPNAVFRFVHLGTEAEVKSINDYFSHFDKRFEAVSGSAADWSDKLRAQLGEDLMLTVNRLPAGLQIQNLDSLYKGRHIAMVLPKSYWQSNPALPHSAVVKVTSLSNDSRLSAQAGRNAKTIADLAFLETSLSQLVSIYKGNFRDLLQLLPYDVFSYSGGRFSLNSATLLSGLLEGIHEQAIALQKLAYQA